MLRVNLLTSLLALLQLSICTKPSHVLGGIGEKSSAKEKRAKKKPYIHANFTHEELANYLRARGYRVKEFRDEDPLVLIGDTAFPPEHVVPELSQSKGRTTAMVTDRLWKTDGKAQTWYFFDTEKPADKELFRECVKMWADNTCIVFTELSPGLCSTTTDHGSVCVGNFDGCWATIGKVSAKGKAAQKMSVQPNACDMSTSVHEFGHALGLFHQQSRPDRDEYLNVNSENFEVKDEDSTSWLWGQGMRCEKDQTVDLPVPFDYMSLMQYDTATFGDNDMRAIFVAKDGHKHYMLGYHTHNGILFSFYDLYTVNTVYGCVESWTKACESNGSTPPKCKNLGYVGKDCKCHCASTFTGATCEKKTGPIYPIMAKAKTMIDVSESKTVDIGEFEFLTTKGDGLVDKFKFYQYFTVISDNSDKKTQVSINVHQNVANAPRYRSVSLQGALIKNIASADCNFVAMWGLTSNGNIRTECLSTMANNELEGPMFRSKTSHLDLIAYSHIGESRNSPEMTVQLFKLKLDVVFVPQSGKILKAQRLSMSKKYYEDGNGDGVGSLEGENITDISGAATGAATAAAHAGIAVGVILLVVLTGAALAIFFFVRHKKKMLAAMPEKLVENLGLDDMLLDTESNSSVATHSDSSESDETEEGAKNSMCFIL